MKLNKILMALSAMAIVGCSSEDFDDPSVAQAIDDSRLIQLDSNFALAGVGDEGATTRTHWEMSGGSLKNKFLPILTKDAAANDVLAADVDPLAQSVGLCWLGQTPGAEVYTNYQFYHFGWLKQGETTATVECEKLTNGAWYNEIKFTAAGDLNGKEPTPTNFAWDGGVVKDFTIDKLNYNSGVYKTDNKAIFGGQYIVYYPFNQEFNEVGTIPAKAFTSFSPVPTTLTDPALGDATFRYSAPIEIKGGDQAGGFGLYNLSALVQLKVTGASGGAIDQIVLWSKKEQLLEQANLAADKIVAGKKGTELYAETKGAKTIVAALGTPASVTETTPVNAYITALPTKVEDLVAFVHRSSDGKWATKELGKVEFVPNSGKLVTINVAAADFKAQYIAVDEATFKTALKEARTAATAANPVAIEVIGDITLKAKDVDGTIVTTAGKFYINDGKDANITIKGDDIIVPEDVALTLRTNMESNVRVLGKTCCSGTKGGWLIVSGGTINNVTMEPTEVKKELTPAEYNKYNPTLSFNTSTTTVAAGKTIDVQAGNVDVIRPVAFKGDINIAKDAKVTVKGTEESATGDLNFMGGTVTNNGTIEVKKGGKFDMTDADGNATATDGKRMTNNGTFIHNVDAAVGTAVQLMNQNGEYRCRVDKQIKLDDAYQKWTACSVIEMVGAGQIYNLGVAEKNINYQHNGKYIDIEVNTTSATTFNNPDLGSGDGDNKNIQVGKLTVMQGGLYVPFVTGEGKRELTVNGDMTVSATASLYSSKKITVKENLIVDNSAVLKYWGEKKNEGGLAVEKDIKVSGATFDAFVDKVDALDITCANFTLADGATAQFGNRTDGDTKNLTVSGTITNPAGCTFDIKAANQVGGSVLATITCKKLIVGGAFPGCKPQVVE